jgi:ADP-ribose pyrophosphatase YjhB (NUDIX family)
MDNVAVTRGSKRFSFRVAGLCVDDGYALLHRAETDDFWALPGGRCQIGESSNLAIERELQEEMGVAVQATRLLWFVENFFGNVGNDDLQVHALAS